MKTIAGRGKGRRILRKLSGRLPSSPASIRLPIALLVLIGYSSIHFFDTGASSLREFWSFCILLGVTLAVLGDFLLYRGRWVAGDLSRIASLLFVNVGMILFVVWAWVSGGEAWFWYATLVYGTILIFALGWSLQGSRGPRVR